MNILIPDSWLREFLKTKATPPEIKEFLSLCGPSVERINEVDGEVVYDIEITTNRPDSMSIMGVAREAAAILPRFGLQAQFINDPYKTNTSWFVKKFSKEGPHRLSITTDPELNPRWTSLVLSDVSIGPSPAWLAKKLELTGIRPLNNIVDITNYLMRTYGQPAHAFDYDSIKPKNGIPTMKLRASRKGEKLTTLDGKTHTLPGNDIVIEDGSGRLIDLCGIMGAENSSVKESTKTVVLFLQTYDPIRIRKTSMALSHRTEAAALFEKGIDTELVLPALMKGVELAQDFAGATPSGKLYDLYPDPYKAPSVSVTKHKLDSYLGTSLGAKEVTSILTSLGFPTAVQNKTVSVTVPGFRRDVSIDVDIIEEVARMYGYHSITTRLPDTEPPIGILDKTLVWEEEVKIRMRDWGFAETYTYSMISEECMNVFSLNPSKTYKISNPLSSEWVYMRPTLLPSMLKTVEENLHTKDTFRLFELSMEYHHRPGDLPLERPALIAAWIGEHLLEAKGLAEALFELLGVPFPDIIEASTSPYVTPAKSADIGSFGMIGEVHPAILSSLKIGKPVTVMKLEFDTLVQNAQPRKKYTPIPKYPPVIEDYSFTVPKTLGVGRLMAALKNVDPLVRDVTLIDTYEQSYTFRVTFQDPDRTLTDEDVAPVRAKIIESAEILGAKLKAI